MSKVKVKTSVASKTMKDPELIGMFNQMVGAGDPDPNIVIPKYERLHRLSGEYLKLLTKMVTNCADKLPEFKDGFSEIAVFIKSSKSELAGLKLEEKKDKVLAGKKLEEINKNPELMARLFQNVTERYDIEDLGKTYMSLKDSKIVQEIIMTGKNIVRLLREEKERTSAEKDNLEDKENLSSDFITKSDAQIIQIFNFSDMNFRHVFISDQTPKAVSDYILLLLRILYNKAMAIFKLVSSPDIDVDKFSDLLCRSIEDIRKHIPRCDKAFDKIKDSVNLLKGNFDNYYVDFIQSQNPGIIIENFVLDVASDSKADVQTTQQFRKIIQFYQKNMKGKVKDPKVQKLFSMLGANLDVLEEKTGAKKATEEERKKEREEAANKAPLTEEEKVAVKDSFLPTELKNSGSKKKRKPRKKRK